MLSRYGARNAVTVASISWEWSRYAAGDHEPGNGCTTPARMPAKQTMTALPAVGKAPPGSLRAVSRGLVRARDGW
jgi:hypothetical protein